MCPDSRFSSGSPPSSRKRVVMMSVSAPPAKPIILPPRFETIPAELRLWTAWVCWRLEFRPGQTKPWTKVPRSPDGMAAKADDPQTWSSYNNVVSAYHRGNLDGVGLQAGGIPNLVGVDIDHCRDVTTGEIEDRALEIVEKLNSYTEVSPSGTGLRLFVYGKLPPKGRKKGPVETYETGHYLTVTGRHVGDTPTTIIHRQEELTSFHKSVFGDAPKDAPRSGVRPPGGVVVQLDDRLLLERAMKAANGARFSALYNGDMTGYASHSEADMALCSHLAFWCGGDLAQIDRLFRQSGLFSQKWVSQRGTQTYGALTIGKVLAGGRESWRPFPKYTRPVIQRLSVKVETMVEKGFEEAGSVSGTPTSNQPFPKNTTRCHVIQKIRVEVA
jgi:putative DNA primase/helicase